MKKAQLEARIKELEQMLQSVQADCSMLVSENLQLVNELKINNIPVPEPLFSTLWADDYKLEEYLERQQENKEHQPPKNKNLDSFLIKKIKK